LAAAISVLGGIRNHPDKQQLLIYDSFYPLNNNSTADIFAEMMSSSPTVDHSYVLAEELYDQLLRVAVNDMIYPLCHSATQQPNVITTNKCKN
jgi:hypothetical protein